MRSDSQAIFELESPEGLPVGLVIFEIDIHSKKRCVSQIPYQILGQNPIQNPTYLLEINTLRTKLKKSRHYLVVASTYQQNLEGNFKLTVSMEQEFKVFDVQEPLLDYEITIKQRWS